MILEITLGIVAGASIVATLNTIALHKKVAVLTKETQRLDLTIAAMSDHMREGQCETTDAINNMAKATGDAVKKEVYNLAFTGIKMWH